MVTASLAARRARVALAFGAVSLGVAVAIALATLALEVGDDLARTLRAAGPNFVALPAGATLPVDAPGLAGAEVLPRAGLALSTDAVAALKTSFWKNNVLDAAPERTAPLILNGRRVEVSGTWFARAVPTEAGPWSTGWAALHSAWHVDGGWPHEDAPEVALGAALARRLGVSVGQHVAVGDRANAARWLVTGVVAAGGLDDGRAWAPLAQVQRLAGRAGIDRVWLSALVRPAPHGPTPDPARDPAGYERYMCAAFPQNVAKELSGRLGADVVPASERLAGEAHVVGRLNLLMLLLALAALTASALGLFSTTTATVVERRVEIGLLRALGAAPRQLAWLLLGETLLVACAGGVIGWLAGSLAAAVIRGSSFGAAMAPQPLLLPAAIVLALLVALAGTWLPLRAAVRVDPAGALRA